MCRGLIEVVGTRQDYGGRSNDSPSVKLLNMKKKKADVLFRSIRL